MRQREREHLKRQIEQAKGKVGQLQGDLSAAKGKLGRMIVELHEADTGLSIGTRVEYAGTNERHAGKRAVVSSTVASGPGWCTTWIAPLKKDGTPGRREERMIRPADWRIVEQAETGDDDER